MAETGVDAKLPTEKSAGIPAAVLGKLSGLVNRQALETNVVSVAVEIQEKALPAMESLRDRFGAVEERMDILNMSDADRQALKEKRAEEQRVAQLVLTPEGRQQLEWETKQKEEAEKERVKKAEEFMNRIDRQFEEADYVGKPLNVPPKTPEELAHEARIQNLTNQETERAHGDFASGDYKKRVRDELREEQNPTPTPKQEVKV